MTRDDMAPPPHPPPEVVDAVDLEDAMPTAAIDIDELDRLTVALDAPRSPRERPFDATSEETKELAEPASWAPCPVEQRKWSHSITVLNPSDLRYGHEPGGRARKGRRSRRRCGVGVGLVFAALCGAAGWYFFLRPTRDNHKSRTPAPSVAPPLPTRGPSSPPSLAPSRPPSAAPTPAPGSPTTTPIARPSSMPSAEPSRPPSTFPTIAQAPTLTYAPTTYVSSSRWDLRTIDASLRGADGSFLQDVNGDGFVDLATPWEESGIVAAYLNPGSSGAWTRVIVANLTGRSDLLGKDGLEDAIFVDLDGDGVLDIVSCAEAGTYMDGREGSWGAGFVRLHFAPPGWSTGAWTTVELLGGVAKWMAAAAADVDNDGRVDLFVGSKESPVAVAVLRQGNTMNDWTYAPISSSIPERWVMSLVAHDVNGDGLIDVVVSFRGTKSGPGVFWLENSGHLSSDWPHHRMLEDAGHRVMMLDLVDLYATGVLDVVVAEERTGAILLEAPDDPRAAWVATHLRTDESGVQIGATVKSVTAGDLDGDGAPELVLSTEDALDDRLGVFYLKREPGARWTTAVAPVDVAGRPGSKFDLVRVADVDGDGAVDIVTSEEDSGLGVVWYRNPGNW